MGHLHAEALDCCEQLQDDIHELERTANNAVLRLIVDELYETTEPLDRCIKRALHNEGVTSERTADVIMTETLNEFRQRTENSLMVAGFVAAASNDKRRVRSILDSIRQLEQLDPEIEPLLLSLCRNPAEKATLQHLQVVRQTWLHEVNSVLACIDQMTDPSVLLRTIDESLQESTRELGSTQEAGVLSCMCRRMSGQTLRVAHICTQLMEQSHDVVFRSNVKREITSLTTAVKDFRMRYQNCLRQAYNITSQNALVKQTNQMLCMVSRVIELCSPKYRSPPAGQNNSKVQQGSRNSPTGNFMLLSPPMLTQSPPDTSVPVSAHAATSQSVPPAFSVADIEGDAAETELDVIQKSSVQKLVADSTRHVIDEVDDTNIPPLSPGTEQLLHDMTDVDVAAAQRNVNAYLSELGVDVDALPVGTADATVVEEKKTKEKPSVASEHKLSSEAKRFLALDVDIAKRKEARASQPVLEAMLHQTLRQQGTRSDVLTNRLLHITTQLNELCNQLSCALSPTQQRELVKESTDLAEITSQLVENARRVTLTDVTALAQLYTQADGWTQQYMCVRGLLESVTREESLLIAQLVSAHRSNNQQLYTQELSVVKTHLEEVKLLQGRSVVNLVTSAELSALNTVSAASRMSLEKLTSRLAHNYTPPKPSSEGEVEQEDWLNVTSLAWSVHACIITSSCSAVANHMSRFLLSVCELTNQNPVNASRDLRIAESRLADLYTAATKREDSVSEKNQFTELMTALNNSNNELHTSQLHHFAPSGLDTQTAQLFADTPTSAAVCLTTARAHVAFIQAAQQALACAALIDDHVAKFHVVPDKLIGIAWKSYAASDVKLKEERKSELDKLSSALRRCVEFIREKLKSVVGALSVQTADILHQTSSELAVIVENLCGVGTAVSDKGATQPLPQEFVRTRRQWAVKAKLLSNVIHNIPALNSQLKKDLMSRLDGSHSELHCSCSTLTLPLPFVKQLPSSDQIRAKLLRAAELAKATKGSFSGLDVVDPVKAKLSTKGSERVAHTTPQRVHITPGMLQKRNPFSSQKPIRDLDGMAKFALKEMELWEDSRNPFVRIAKQMNARLVEMARFCRGDGPLTKKDELVNNAKDLAADAVRMQGFAGIIARHCTSATTGDALMREAECINAFCKQLNIVADVKAATPRSRAADQVLVKNAENLLQSVAATLRACEAACVKGLRTAEGGEEADAVVLATEWRRRHEQRRQLDSATAAVDELGLRVTNPSARLPSMSDVLQRHSAPKL